MRERRICGKGVMWLVFGLLFFLCAGMGITAVEGKAAEGETGEDIIVLDENNMDSAGRIYSISGYAIMRGIDLERYKEIDGDVDIAVPQKVEKDGKVYLVKSIALNPLSAYECNLEYIKGKLVLYIGPDIVDVSIDEIKSEKVYCEVITGSENFYSCDGSLFGKAGTELIHFYDGGNSEGDVYHVPQGVIRIREGAFYQTKLGRVVLPDSVTEIGYSAFYGAAIKTVDLRHVTSVGHSAFRECKYLEEVRFGEPVRLSERSFAGDNSLKNVYIPDGSSMDWYCFEWCKSLKNVVMGTGCTLLKGEGTDGIFSVCRKLETIIFPEDWRVIPTGFLLGDYHLDKIYLPDSVNVIGQDSLSHCKLALYGKAEALMDNYEGGEGYTNIQFENTQSHSHKLENVTFFSYSTWALTGKYCYACGYGTDCAVTEIPTMSDKEKLPPLLIHEEPECDEVRELNEDNMDDNGFVYKLNDLTMTAGVTKFDRFSAKRWYVTIPSTVCKNGKEYEVKEILHNGLYGAMGVWISDSVKYLEDCIGGYNINLGAGVEKIDKKAFASTGNIVESITVSEKNQSFIKKDRTLFDKDQTRLLKFTDSNWGEEEKRIYTVPATVTQIDGGAFYGIKELEQINIYKRADLTIVDGAFDECSAKINYLEYDENRLVLDENNMDVQGCVYVLNGNSADIKGIDLEQYEDAAGDVEIRIPEEVEKEGSIYSVTSVSLYSGSTVYFEKGTKINSLKGKLMLYLSNTVRNISFSGINSGKLYCDSDIENRYFSAINGSLYNKDGTDLIRFYDGECGSEDIVFIPASITKLRGSAFYGTKLKGVVLPEGITYIPDSAFANSDIISINLNYITGVGPYAFSNCKYLKEVRFGKEVIIGERAFSNNDSLEGVYIPGDSYLDMHCFEECKNLRTVLIGSGTTLAKNMGNMFALCCRLETVILPEDWKSIPHDFFGCCYSLGKLYLPDSVEIIETGGMLSCKTDLYGTKESLVSDYEVVNAATRLCFHDIKDHAHKLEDVTFFGYETWAVTGKYCYGCGYGTDIMVTDLQSSEDQEDLPKLLVHERKKEDTKELDKDNKDSNGLVYKLDDTTMTSEVDEFDYENALSWSVNIPSKVIKEGKVYTVERINELVGAYNIDIPDTVKEIHRLGYYSSQHTIGKICFGAEVEQMDVFWTWNNVKVDSLNVSANNKNFCMDGRGLFDTEKTQLIKYTDYNWGRGEKRIYTVPDSVTKINHDAFYHITELDQINIYLRDDLEVAENAFEKCTAKINYIETEKPSVPEPTSVPTAAPTAKPTATPEPEGTPDSSTDKPIPTPDNGSTPIPDVTVPTPTPVPVNNIGTSLPGLIPTASPAGSGNITKDMLVISQFRVKLTGKNHVSLSWNRNQYASGYRIYRAKKKSGVYKKLKNLRGTSVIYTDKTAKKNKKYYYRIEAYRTCSDRLVTGKRTAACSIRIPAFIPPKIVVHKRRMGKIRYITIRLKKYKGKYADIYVAQGTKKFKKLKLVSSKIAKYKKKFKIQYKVRNKVLRVRVRTFDKKKKKKLYSGFSKTVKVKV